MPYIDQLTTEYLTGGKTRMMQLATAVNGQPWCCTVYYAVDSDLNLIWISTPDRCHSQAITENSNIAGAIAYDQQPGSQPFVQGLQFEGVATMLTGDEEAAAAQTYAEQLHRKDDLLADIRSGKNPHKVYKVHVSKYVLFDSKNFPEQPRQEWAR